MSSTNQNSQFQILLYYKYVHLEDPHQVMEWQRQMCTELHLKGRIIIATEGINGTVEGSIEATEKYIAAVMEDPRFDDINWKRSPGNGNAFPKLSIKVREEIVSAHLGENDVNPVEVTGKYLSADELHQWFENGEEFYIVDMRNDYEHASGHFRGSILPNLGNFRDLPQILPDLEHLRDKKVVTVCTGGVRCEKASGFLVKNGFKDVYQLKDGIVTYMERYPNQHYLGKLYVFDGRELMGFNTEAAEHVIVGKCGLCGQSSENYINCAYDPCHKRFICCENCIDAHGKAYCSGNCVAHDGKLTNKSLIAQIKLAN